MKRHGNYTRVLTLGQVHTMTGLYREGWTLQRLADQYGVSAQAIWKLLKRRGVPTRPRHPKRVDARGRYLALSADTPTRVERDNAGIIVSLREQQSGERYALHVPGLRRDALEHVAWLCDTWTGDWRLACYSTPHTIYGDLQGMRIVTDDATSSGVNVSHEAMALGAIGRLDLLAPELDR